MLLWASSVKIWDRQSFRNIEMAKANNPYLMLGALHPLSQKMWLSSYLFSTHKFENKNSYFDEIIGGDMLRNAKFCKLLTRSISLKTGS